MTYQEPEQDADTLLLEVVLRLAEQLEPQTVYLLLLPLEVEPQSAPVASHYFLSL